MSVIESLYNSYEIDECIAKMVRDDLRPDFKQELFVILCEQEERLQKIPVNQLRFYVVRIIINLATQKRNIYHTKYLSCNSELNDKHDKDYEYTLGPIIEKERSLLKLETSISRMDEHFGTFLHRAVIQLVMNSGSVSKAAKLVGIPKRTIYRILETAKEHLRTQLT